MAKNEDIKIQSAGVFRCCLESIGGDYIDRDGEKIWQVFENPKQGDEDYCEHCGRKFILNNNRWQHNDYPED